MSNTPITQIQLRRGTSSQWTTSTVPLAEGELGYATDTGELRIGKSGGSLWNTSNAAGGGNGGGSTLTFSGPTGAVPYLTNASTLTGSSNFRYFGNTGYNGGETGILLIDGDLCVKGTIDPVSIILTPTTTNPNPGVPGALWFSSSSGTLQNGSAGPIGVGSTGATGPSGGGTGPTGPRGIDGSATLTGSTGPTGFSGIPTGGNTGHVLTKKSGSDYDTIWSPPSGGGGGTLNYGYITATLLAGGNNTFDTASNTLISTNFSSNIGTWPSAPAIATELVLTFNSSYTQSKIPLFIGGTYNWNSNIGGVARFDHNTLSLSAVGVEPTTSLSWNGTNWVLRYVIAGTTFPSTTSNSPNFVLYMLMLN
jgi:hypothetical protein